jgi:predicted nucleic acid-binding protein
VNYLIDTNVISEIRKGTQCSANVTAWYARIEDESLYLSALVLGEIRKGIERARPKDPTKARNLEKWLVAVASAFSGRILPIDAPVAEEWGRMNAIRPVPVIDGLLAATAKIHGMTLVTRNVDDVADLGTALINPFEFELPSP